MDDRLSRRWIKLKRDLVVALMCLACIVCAGLIAGFNMEGPIIAYWFVLFIKGAMDALEMEQDKWIWKT